MKKHLNTLLLIIHALALSLLYPLLPQEIAMQYNSQGQVNYYFSKPVALISLIALHIIILIVSRLQNKSQNTLAITQLVLMLTSIILLWMQH